MVAVGDGVDPGWIGSRVIAHPAVSSTGGYAQLALAEASMLRRVPAGLDLAAATALLHDGPSALALIRGTGVASGRSALVVNAAGGLGPLLVQMAHAPGATVVGAARGDQKLELIRAQGADAAVDHGGQGWPQEAVRRNGGEPFDIVLDGAGGEIGRQALDITAIGGRFSAHGAPAGFSVTDPAEARRRGIELTGIELVQFTPERAARGAGAGGGGGGTNPPADRSDLPAGEGGGGTCRHVRTSSGCAAHPSAEPASGSVAPVLIPPAGLTRARPGSVAATGARRRTKTRRRRRRGISPS